MSIEDSMLKLKIDHNISILKILIYVLTPEDPVTVDNSKG